MAEQTSIDIQIKTVVTPAALATVEALQQVVLAATAVTPLGVLVSLAANGGQVLAAYDRGQPVGFAISYVALDRGPSSRVAASRLKLEALSLGVLPAYRGLGVAQRLKFAQLEYATKLGIRLITWAYDPLDSGSARLNLSTLGAIAREYAREFAAVDRPSDTSLTLQDRLLVEWWPTKPRVQQRLKGGRKSLTLKHYTDSGLTVANPARRAGDGRLIPADYLDVATRPIMIVETPVDIDTLAAQDTGLAQAWREHVRRVFEQLFAVGFIATDFIVDDQATDDPRAYYVLAQGNASLGA